MKIMQGDAYPIKFKTNSFTVDEDTVYYCKGEFNIKKYTDKYL